MTLLAEARAGQVFVALAPPLFAPWELSLCERLAAKWEARGGSWQPDAVALRKAVREARAWADAHPPEIEYEEGTGQ